MGTAGVGAEEERAKPGHAGHRAAGPEGREEETHG